MAKLLTKSPTGILDFTVTWTTWLNGDTIATSVWTADAGITIDSEDETTLVAIVWLSGGTLGEVYHVTNTITTAAGRTNDEILSILVKYSYFTYIGDLSTDLDKTRFYIQDTVENAGPKPADGNFTDAEITGTITAAGDWEAAVAELFDVLAANWTRHADITVGPRRQSFSQIANGFRKQAAEWRKKYGIGTPIVAAAMIPVDGYSDDVRTDEVENTSGEYAATKIYWTEI